MTEDPAVAARGAEAFLGCTGLVLSLQPRLWVGWQSPGEALKELRVSEFSTQAYLESRGSGGAAGGDVGS